MLGRHELAIIAALKARPGIQKTTRTVGSLPAVPDDQRMLQRYLVDAPALYVTEGAYRIADDMGVLSFTVGIVVRNVAGNAQARLGDGVTTGADQLLTLVLRALHGRRIGEASWTVRRAEYLEPADVFEAAGLTVLGVSVESSPMALPDDPEELDSLGDLRHVHLDMDIAPHAVSGEYGKWLAEPPDYSDDQPDLQADIPLAGAGANEP
ncbi:Mu-like prophage protein gp37 [Bordetella ansorpii]|uniref:Mu-like prophage protein gp37 n=1 Tax=Bordetella ansorpii TaxID=288768 RepID=A0A157SVT4_9BORD|nr:hypothetical protein [Bordetella ansorpii]SAI74570.1 Mu-like prophage protein gp37 [Bordetella ansorpii]